MTFVKIFFLFLLLTLTSSSTSAQGCQVKNTSFTFGERLDYVIYYYFAGIWVSAGTVYFEVDSSRIGDELYYHFDSYGRTYKKYDWIYKVRDHYQAYANAKTFQPLRFNRSVNEGSTYIREDCIFNQKRQEAYTLRQLDEDAPLIKDTVPLQPCIYDPMTTIYYGRTLDFSDVEVNEKVPLKSFLDNQVYDTYVRYLRKENLKVKGLGEFKCIVFSPLLIEGTMFNIGEDMTVWVTDDQNRIPLLIKTPILVGDIKARLSDFKGLRHEIKSKISD